MKFLNYVYTNNPFYLISACLVLIGSRKLFPSDDSPAYAWALIALLMAYTTLLAVTAIAIIRLGKVWDDARSILLITLLLLLAVSASFDQVVVSDPTQGSALLLGGFVFALFLSEAVQRKLKIKLPRLFRVPYYLALALFFFYPAFLTLLLHHGDRSALEWGEFGFSSIFGVTLLGLMPMARRGSHFQTGTPWKGTAFLWVIISILGLGACVRSYWLGLSFGLGSGQETTFSPYFLVPILLSLTCLALETAIQMKWRWLKRLALGAPVVSLGLTLLGTDGAPQEKFLTDFLTTVDSPARLTLIIMLALYGFAWFRGVRGSEAGFSLSLLLLTIVRGHTISLETLVTPQPDFLYLFAALQLTLALRRRSLVRCLAAGGATLTGASLTFSGALRTLSWPAGLTQLICGLAFLLLAVWVSLMKAGVRPWKRSGSNELDAGVP